MTGLPLAVNSTLLEKKKGGCILSGPYRIIARSRTHGMGLASSKHVQPPDPGVHEGTPSAMGKTSNGSAWQITAMTTTIFMTTMLWDPNKNTAPEPRRRDCFPGSPWASLVTSEWCPGMQHRLPVLATQTGHGARSQNAAGWAGETEQHRTAFPELSYLVFSWERERG